MKMIKTIFAASVLGAAVLSQSVGADFLNDVTCGTFGAWAQATYLKPTHGGQNWALQTEFDLDNPGAPGSANGPFKSRYVCPKYDWGFEVGGAYLTQCDCFYAKLFGGWTKFTDSAAADGFLAPNLPLFPIQGTFGSVAGSGRASLRTEYWYIDARIGHFLMRGCGSDVHAFLGVRYVDLCERLKTRFNGTNSAQTPTTTQINQSQRSEFGGTGPELGLGGQFCVWGDFGISGELGASALIGTRKNRVRSIEESFTVPLNQTQEFQYDNCIAVIPAIAFRAAVNWTMEYGCIKGGVELGYKLDHYFNAFNSAVSPGNTTILRDVGFAGPFLGIGIAY